MDVKRGDVVLVAPPGEFGKPRPAIIIQSDNAFSSGFYTYVPITSDLLRVPDIRVPVLPTSENGLIMESEIMVDMIQTSSMSRFGRTIGVVDTETLSLVQRALALHLAFSNVPIRTEL